MNDDGPSWYAPVAAMIQANGGSGGFVVAFPEYRPDLVQGLASVLSLELRDFRAEQLAPRGWQAGKVSLAELDVWIGEAALRGGAVAQNVEALLAAKSAVERCAWLREFLDRQVPAPIVLPITVFTSDLPTGSPRVVTLATELVPELTLLRRLLG